MGYIAIILVCLSVTGCAGSIIDSEKRIHRAEADLAESRAKIAQQYQRCLERYESEPEKLKAVCAAYNQESHQSGPTRWVWLVESNQGENYIDPTTIRRSEGYVKVLTLSDFQAEQHAASGVSFLSSVGEMEFDCGNERARMLDMSFFSGHMGRGTLVYSKSGESNWMPVRYAVALVMWKYACNKGL